MCHMSLRTESQPEKKYLYMYSIYKVINEKSLHVGTLSEIENIKEVMYFLTPLLNDFLIFIRSINIPKMEFFSF